MTLRTKLILSQAPLAVALGLVGVVASAVTVKLGEQSGLILADNYRSVLAAQAMKDALARIDRLALSALAGQAAGPGQLARERERFERAEEVQEGNLTEPGEGEATARLRQSWSRHRAALAHFEAAADPEARRRLYFDELAPAFRTVDEAANEILALNQDAMVRKSTRAERAAERLQVLVVTAVLGAALLGLLASIWLTARLLRPLGVVTAAVRRFGQGDVAARAQLAGKDELAQLAAEFNRMAEHLERYRQSSLGELMQAQQAAQAAIDGLPDPVIILDGEGHLQVANEAATAVLAVSTEGPADPFARTDPGVHSLFDRLSAHVLGGKGAYVPRGFEEAVRVAGREGERIFMPRATPIYAASGAVAGAAIVLQDITRVFRFDELKNNLVATVAHEFRTPLTSLRMAIHLCTEETVGPLTPKQADLLFAARDDCERLQGIVDDLLNLSRLESGRIDLHRRRMETEALVAMALDIHRTAAEQAQVTVRAEVIPGCPEVFADPDRLQLVFTNLLSNALRFAPAGSEVVVRAAPADADARASVRFEVADQGPGIPREHQAGLFEKFYRVPGSPEGGSGLGLFIARGIVQAHGGQIAVDSAPGQGTRFWFTVPAAPDLAR
jgi:two-component system, NtrC family, sensor histidine kinase KinB